MPSFHPQNYFRFMLYIAFILSETQFLINAQLYLPKCSIPYFTFSYFIITTLYLTYAVISYGLFNKQEKAETLQLYEYIMLPVSVLCISIEGANVGMIEVKVTACILLVAQSLLIICKIMNFSSVSEELAQISTVIRVVRTVKLILFAILPLLVQSRLIIVAIISIFQILSIAIFLFKFTYQKFIYEYVLLIGISCGIFSCLQSVVEVVFGFSYFFLGESLSLYFYFGQNTFLQNILQIKYTSSLKRSSESKQDDQVLAGLLFINQCLFDPQRFKDLSSHSKNEATIYAYLLLQQSKLNNIKGQIHFNQDSVFQMSQEDCKIIKRGFFDNYLHKFHQTDNFNCFQFTVSKALQLNKANKALILYYGFMERRKMKMSMLQQCKYQYLYNKIAKQIDQTEKDQQDINFISFTENLRALKKQLEQCLTFELKLIQSLNDKNKKAEMFGDARLLVRHQMKRQIRKRIGLCMDQGIYFSSNEFKYLYLLYQVSIQKRFFNLQLELHKYFLANQVQKLRFQTNQNSLLVLSGFIHGQIINSNQIFKNYFAVTNSFNKSNISEYLPTQKQRTKHFTLMSQFVSFQIKQCPKHSQYQCYLAIEREIGALKLKTIQNFTISARIYYQNSNAFNFVCCLTPKENHNTIKKKLFLTKKDCKSFINKGIQFLILGQSKIQQLDQSIDLCQIEFNYESQNSLLTQNIHLQEDKIERENQIIQNNKKAGDFLQEKASSIQRKFTNLPNHLQYNVFNITEIGSVVVVAFLIIASSISVKIAVNDYSSSISELLEPINDAELAHNIILLQQEILSFSIQTSFFADNICSPYGIASIKTYIGDHLSSAVQDKTDQFINSINILHNYGIINQNLYSKNFQASPYLNNYDRNVSFQKYIRLMKAYNYIWLNQLNTTPLNQYFYSQEFPSIMLNSTLNNPNSMTAIISKAQDQYVQNIMVTISHFSVISFVSISFFLLLTITLRLYDNRTIVEYLKIIECIPSDKLSERSKEIKCSLQQLRQLQSRRIESVQFQVSFAVQIISDKKDTQNIPIKQFTEWHIQSKAQNDNDQSNQSSYQDQFQLIQKQSQNQPSIFFESAFYRLISYNKIYLSFMLAAIIAVTILGNTTFMTEGKRVETLVLCKQASLQLNQIQQKMINIVGYNWLKVLSLYMPIKMTNAKSMYNEAILYLMKSDYNEKIRAAYSKDISDQILHGEVCQYFNNKTACEAYRNNIFSSGFSILNPLVVKEQIEVDSISTNPQYYIFNLCDKTWLLFEGIVSMTDGIAHYGYNKMNEKIDTPLSLKLVPIVTILILVLIVSIICQQLRRKRQIIIRQQVFSIETVDKLYTVAEYKPFFNQIYYS